MYVLAAYQVIGYNFITCSACSCLHKNKKAIRVSVQHSTEELIFPLSSTNFAFRAVDGERVVYLAQHQEQAGDANVQGDVMVVAMRLP